MKQRKVISSENMPLHFPIAQMIAMYLLLDRFNAPSWAYGIIFTIYAIVCVAVAVGICNQRSIDLFKD